MGTNCTSILNSIMTANFITLLAIVLVVFYLKPIASYIEWLNFRIATLTKQHYNERNHQNHHR